MTLTFISSLFIFAGYIYADVRRTFHVQNYLDRTYDIFKQFIKPRKVNNIAVIIVIMYFQLIVLFNDNLLLVLRFRELHTIA